MPNVVISDRSAGEYWIDSYSKSELWSNDNPNGLTFQQLCGSHGQIVFEGTKKECKKYIEDLAKETVRWAVYYDRPAGYGSYSKENATSGAWKGKRNYMADFETEEEAKQYLHSL